MENKLVRILKRVQEPSRYVGGEALLPTINDSTRVKFCLCYPERYEVGMGDLELKVIYHMLNDRKGYSCERCFAPWLDMGSELKKENLALFSLETKTPLNKFDLLGFHVTNTLNYTNILYMLDLGMVPLKAVERGENHPLVYGFGNCMYNPEPLSDFLDFAIIGDSEDLNIKVIDTINKAKLSKFNKAQTLKMLSELEGVYVPSLVNYVYDKSGKLSKLNGKVVKRQIVRDLDRAYFPTKLVIPNEETICDRARLELVRGCSHGCRFCQYGYVNRPVRERRVQTVMSHATGQIVSSGFDELYLTAPYIKDYSALPSLLKLLDPLCLSKRVKLVAPNILSSENQECKSIAKSRALRLSLEAGTEKLRNVINKNISDDDIQSELKLAFESGISKVEYDFMIGLPFETAEDLIGIVNVVKKTKELYKTYKTSTKPLNIFVHIDNFIPKPFTPFQWCSYIGKEEAKKRQTFLSYAFKKLGVKAYMANPEASEIDAIYTRGDRAVGKLLLEAYNRGAIFDGLDDVFDYGKYRVAYYISSLNPDSLNKRKDVKDVLPWDLIDVGINKEYLASEFLKAKQHDITKDCKHGCNVCGLAKMGACKYGRC